MIAALTQTALFAAAAPKKTSSSPAFLIFILIAAGFYFLIYRPQQRKAKAQREQGKKFDVGDEVLTAGGIVGHIIDIEDDRVTLETSVGASFVVLNPYILRKLEAPVSSSEFEDEDEDEDDVDEEADGGEYDEVEGAHDDETVAEEEDQEDHVEAEDDEGGDDQIDNSTNGKRSGSGRRRWRSGRSDARGPDGE
jgi:preprotein translocase subunit YajC